MSDFRNRACEKCGMVVPFSAIGCGCGGATRPIGDRELRVGEIGEGATLIVKLPGPPLSPLWWLAIGSVIGLAIGTGLAW